MTSFFLLLSFLIHAISFITIYHLYERTKKDKDAQMVRLEEMLTTFMKNIQLENDKLEKKIYETEIRQQVISNEAPNIPREPEINVNNPVNDSDWLRSAPEKNQVDIVETSIESQVLQLVKEGKSSEEIAKQLNRGKTEVDLYIKLNRLANDS